VFATKLESALLLFTKRSFFFCAAWELQKKQQKNFVNFDLGGGTAWGLSVEVELDQAAGGLGAGLGLGSQRVLNKSRGLGP
jgi:hypothetical protein